MDTVFSKLFFKFQNKKIYATLILFALLVIGAGVVSYFEIKKEIVNIGKEFKNSISEEISFNTNSSIKAKVNTVESFALFIDKYMKNSTNDEILDYIKSIRNLVHDSPLFDHYQILLNPRTIIFDDKIKELDTNFYSDIKSRVWYKSTVDQNKTIVSTFDKHAMLDTKTIHICTPFYRNSFPAVFCGIIKADEFFAALKPRLNLYVSNIYLFDKEAKIISSAKDSFLKDGIEKEFINFNKQHQEGEFSFDKKQIFITKISNWQWYIGVEMDESAITSNIQKIILKNGVLLLALFGFVVFTSNLLHTFIYNKIFKKQKDYDLILSRTLKMAETGELISAISHQLKQPINSSLLLLSDILNRKKNDEITEVELLENINLAIKSNILMDKTIENFRKFYKFSDDLKKFDLYESIANLIKILNVEFSRYNISTYVDKFKITLYQKESFLQQILLVLLQNSKDALKSNKKDRKIRIKAILKDNFVTIFVYDNGHGIKNPSVIFDKYKKSTKMHGSGVGLYLSKVIAKEKLLGELDLKQSKNPTVFRLTIKQNLE